MLRDKCSALRFGLHTFDSTPQGFGGTVRASGAAITTDENLALGGEPCPVDEFLRGFLPSSKFIKHGTTYKI